MGGVGIGEPGPQVPGGCDEPPPSGVIKAITGSDTCSSFLNLELETNRYEEYDAIQKTANSANKTMPMEAANTKPGIRSGGF
jgi:hypothetical protein